MNVKMKILLQHDLGRERLYDQNPCLPFPLIHSAVLMVIGSKSDILACPRISSSVKAFSVTKKSTNKNLRNYSYLPSLFLLLLESPDYIKIVYYKIFKNTIGHILVLMKT